MKSKSKFLLMCSLLLLWAFGFFQNYMSTYMNDEKKTDMLNISDMDSWYRTWGGSADDTGKDIILDSENNIYIAGDTVSFGPGGFDIALLKYNNLGTLNWNTTWGGSSTRDSARGIVQDSLNNVYIAGDTATYLDGMDFNICLIKFNESGNVIWDLTWGGAGDDHCTGLTIDPYDNLYIVGYSGNDTLLLKYNSSGILEWSRIWKESIVAHGYAIALDTLGNIYIAGAIDDDMLLLKCDSSGFVQWYRRCGGSDYDFAFGIASDSQNNIYIAGHTYSYDDWGDVLIVKYDNLGTFQWNYSLKGKYADVAEDIALDSYGNPIIVGDFYGPHYDDILLLNCSTEGELNELCVWSDVSKDSEETPSALAIDLSNNIYVTGSLVIPSQDQEYSNLLLVKNPYPCKITKKNPISGFNVILILGLVGITMTIVWKLKINNKE